MKQIKLITITLVLYMFVGGASAGITYDAGSNTVTVTGYTKTSPCTFQNLYDADVAGGWGVISKTYDQYAIFANLNFGNSARAETWFADEGKQINIISPGGREWINIYVNATVRLGECTSHVNKTTTKGCYLAFQGDGGNNLIYGRVFNGESGNLEMYGSTIYRNSIAVGGTIINTYNIICYNTMFIQIDLSNINNATFDNVILQNSFKAVSSVYPNTQRIRIENPNIGIRYNSRDGNVVLKNIKIINPVYTVKGLWNSLGIGDLYLVDCESTTWTLTYSFFNKRIYRQYTFNLQTIPNAKITIMNHTDIVYQDYAYDNGTIGEQILTMGYYMETTMSTLNSQNPYSIEIKKEGYHTYAQEFTLNEPTKLHILLMPDRVQVGSKIIRPARRS